MMYAYIMEVPERARSHQSDVLIGGSVSSCAPRSRQSFQCSFQVLRVLVAVDRERGVQVGVSKRLGSGVDSGDAPQLGRERVARAVHVQASSNSARDEFGVG